MKQYSKLTLNFGINIMFASMIDQLLVLVASMALLWCCDGKRSQLCCYDGPSIYFLPFGAGEDGYVGLNAKRKREKKKQEKLDKLMTKI